MKFKELIMAAGIDSNEYPKLSDVQLILTDRKHHIISSPLILTKPLFEENVDSERRFKNLLEKIEKYEQRPKCVQCILSESIVSLHWSYHVRCFSRIK